MQSSTRQRAKPKRVREVTDVTERRTCQWLE